jgi:hypothetical protein
MKNIMLWVGGILLGFMLGYWTPHRDRLGIAPLDMHDTDNFNLVLTRYCVLEITDADVYGPYKSWCLNPTEPWHASETERMLKVLAIGKK